MSGTVIVGAQWGDEGKGKIVDLLAERFDDRRPLPGRLERRPHRGRRRRDVQVPAAALGHPRPGQALRARQRRRDRPRRRCARSSTSSRAAAAPTSGLRISGNAHLVMPWHRILDAQSERAARTAADRHHEARHRPGLRRQGVAHRHPRAGPARPRRSCARRSTPRSRSRTSSWSASTASSRSTAPSWSPTSTASPIASSRTSPTPSKLLDDALDAGQAVLFEGAQGTHARPRPRHVSVRHLVEPGRRRRLHRQRRRPDADHARRRRRQGVPDPRRRGPVPERGRPRARRERCATVGGEFGTVTGRARRCGWLDLVGAALRRARQRHAPSSSLTKLDVLSAFDEIPVCTALPAADGSVTADFPPHQSDFHHAEPACSRTLPGWGADISRVTALRRPARRRPRLRGVHRGAPRRARHAGRRRPAPRPDPRRPTPWRVA